MGGQILLPLCHCCEMEFCKCAFTLAAYIHVPFIPCSVPKDIGSRKSTIVIFEEVALSETTMSWKLPPLCMQPSVMHARSNQRCVHVQL